MITCKLGTMRKAVEWSVYPPDRTDDKNCLMIQCERRIAYIYIKEKKVLLSDGKGGHPAGWKLLPSQGAKLFDCPQEVIDAAIAAQPKPGDKIGGMLVIA